MRSWSNSFFPLLRMLFLGLKLLSLLAFFTQVNDDGENCSWKAIGYCGPDPDFKVQIPKYKSQKGIVDVHQRSDRSEKEDQDVGEEEKLFGPLYKGIVNLNNPRQIVAEALQRSGFGVSTPHHKVSTPDSSLNPSLIIKCDAVVVGSGSGGGVIAVQAIAYCTAQSVLEVLRRKKSK
ncbi:long-chain-alcohol oxidase [Sarracenia purpurea var. burkii]